MEQGHRWVIDADVSEYFDSIDHGHLRSFLDLRIKDGVVRRMIDKWLTAGVLEESTLKRSDTGAPQGGVLSPMLSNIFLHYVLDEWFERVAKPRLRGSCRLVRFADDFVMTFEDDHSGKRMLGRPGETARPLRAGPACDQDPVCGLPATASEGTCSGRDIRLSGGLPTCGGRSRRGKSVVRRITAKSRFARGGESGARLVQT